MTGPASATVVRQPVYVQVGKIGVPGPKGDPGAPPEGAPTFVQADAPTSPGGNYAWWQTELGDGTDMTLWIEDGT